MPSVGVGVVGDGQRGVAARRRAVGRAQQAVPPLDVQQLVVVQLGGLVPALLEIREHVVRGVAFDFAVPVVPRLPWSATVRRILQQKTK